MKIALTDRNSLRIIMPIMGILLCLRAIHNVFLYPLIALSLAIFAFCPLTICLPILFFLLPSANIIKVSPGQISIFTVFYAITVFRIIFKNGQMEKKLVACVVLFVMYSILFSGVSQIVTIVTMAFGFILLHDTSVSDGYDYSTILTSYALGIILASTLGVFKSQLPIIERFVSSEMMKIGHKEYMERFSGLHGNPNYYTLDLTVVLSCLVVSMCMKKITIWNTILFLCLTVFGLMSISKSFLMACAFLVAMLLFFSLRNGLKSFIGVLLVLVIAGISVYYFAEDSINGYIMRLLQDSESNSDISSMTTGRWDIWETYFNAIFEDPKLLLLGKGIGGSLVDNKGAHNTYIEFIYYLGIVGTTIYLCVLKSVINLPHKRRNVLLYVPIVAILIRFLAIGVLIYDNVWYYYALICLMWSDDDKRRINDA